MDRINLLLAPDALAIILNAKMLADEFRGLTMGIRHIILAMFRSTDIGLSILSRLNITDIEFANLCIKLDEKAFKFRYLDTEDGKEQQEKELLEFVEFIIMDNKIDNTNNEYARFITSRDFWVAFRDILDCTVSNNFSTINNAVSAQTLEEIQDIIDGFRCDKEEFINVIDSALGKFNIGSEDEIPNESDIPSELSDIISHIEVNKDNIATTSYFTNMSDDLLSTVKKLEHSNVVVVGENGVGKSTFIDLVIAENSHKFNFVKLDPIALLKGVTFIEVLDDRLSKIANWAKSNENTVFVCDDIGMIFGKSNQTGVSMLAVFMSKYMRNNEIKMIGTMSQSSYRKYFRDNTEFSKLFQEVKIDEPTDKDRYIIAYKMADKYRDSFKLKFDNKLVEYAIKISEKYMRNVKFPGRLAELLDKSFALASINDKDTVTSNDIRTALKYIVHNDKIDDSDLNNARYLVENTKKLLKTNVIGQDDVLSEVNKVVRRSVSDIRDTNRPKAVMLFVGPTGVGKTETAKVLAESLYGDRNKIIRIDMSEYSEKHTVSRLFGAPPGYIGYEEGGQLTEQIRENPDSIVLLDEIEKANEKVFNALLQVFDDGRLTDGKGNTVDFTNSIIIMTSNAGYGLDKAAHSVGFGSVDLSDEEVRQDIVEEALKDTFRPEFINRIDSIIAFNSLTKANCKDIVKLQIDKIKERLANKNIKLTVSDAVIDRVIKEGYSEKFGARNINRTVRKLIEDNIIESLIYNDSNIIDAVHVKMVGNNVKVAVHNFELQGLGYISSLDSVGEHEVRE